MAPSLGLVGRYGIVSFEMMGSDTQELPLLVPTHRQVANDLCRADAVGQSTIHGRLNDLRVEEGQLDHHADVAAAFALTRGQRIDTIDTPGDQVVQP